MQPASQNGAPTPANSWSLFAETAELGEDIWDHSWLWEMPACQSCFLQSLFTVSNWVTRAPRQLWPCPGTGGGYKRLSCSTGSSPPFASEQAGAKAAPAFLLHYCFRVFLRDKWVVSHCAGELRLPPAPFHPREAPPQDCRGYGAD